MCARHLCLAITGTSNRRSETARRSSSRQSPGEATRRPGTPGSPRRPHGRPPQPSLSAAFVKPLTTSCGFPARHGAVSCLKSARSLPRDRKRDPGFSQSDEPSGLRCRLNFSRWTKSIPRGLASTCVLLERLARASWPPHGHRMARGAHVPGAHASPSSAALTGPSVPSLRRPGTTVPSRPRAMLPQLLPRPHEALLTGEAG